MKKVDVIVNVYGKPWQTLCTLKSLIKHSGKHIDKIYFIKEKEQPYNENIDWVLNHFDNVILFEPSEYNFLTFQVNFNDENQRFKVRYQYGIEKSDKQFVFITHNDVLYTGDIIGEMLEQIGDSVGIGELGQCWNCPANKIGVCSGEKFNDWNPTYEDILKLPLPHIRTNLNMIDPINPKPLPECRLNEWACLLNKEIIMKESYPYGNVSLFGQYGLDLATKWFKEMYLKGYKFIDYRKNYTHSFWSELPSGYQTQLNSTLYINSELNAKKYFEENFN
jgi:hypothetical protein